MTREEFLKDVANWDNHRHFLWSSLEATIGGVVEMGMGNGSTPYLHQYCQDAGRFLTSYENDLQWLDRFSKYQTARHKLVHVTDWDIVSENHPNPGVVLVDHAPGERRKVDIQRFANKALVLVVHDTEPAADHGYQMRAELEKFKYRNDFFSPGAWATVASNFIDVTKFQA